MTTVAKSKTATVTVRLSLDEIAKLDLEAAAVHMDRSPYIRMILSGRSPPQPSASLAALAQLISVCATIKTAQGGDRQQLQDLELLVRTLARAVREESR